MTREEAIEIIKSATVYTPEEIEALKVLIPEFMESKDERINRTIFKALCKKDARDVLLAEGIQVSDALAYLDKLKTIHCRPIAGWSEENKKMLNNIISSLRGHLYTTTKGKNGTDYESYIKKEISWLESLPERLQLKPSWKPSREQMDSLRDTIVNTKGYSYSIYLPELYEQLQKLIKQ